MLPKNKRIRKDIEFQKVFKKSKPVFGANLSIRFSQRQANTDPNTRFGFIVSNKIDKRATRRNAIKRQLREVASDLISSVKSGYDVVVVLKCDFDYPYDQKVIKSQFSQLLKKAGLLKSEKDNY